MRRDKCPICDKPMAHVYKPFCSKRCAQLDLGGWLNESYTIPAIELPEDEEEPSVPQNKESYH
jgi:endogenous inhibitor of DNA gyrase (YacG/DUF329 family)